MAENFTVEVVTPTTLRTFDGATAVRAPGLDGYFGVLPNHVPAIFALKPGEVKIRAADGLTNLASSGGYCEVRKDKVLLLVETAELPSDIDVDRAQEALDRAKKRIEAHESGLNADRARIAIERAINRMRIASRR